MCDDFLEYVKKSIAYSYCHEFPCNLCRIEVFHFALYSCKNGQHDAIVIPDVLLTSSKDTIHP